MIKIIDIDEKIKSITEIIDNKEYRNKEKVLSLFSNSYLKKINSFLFKLENTDFWIVPEFSKLKYVFKSGLILYSLTITKYIFKMYKWILLHNKDKIKYIKLSIDDMIFLGLFHKCHLVHKFENIYLDIIEIQNNEKIITNIFDILFGNLSNKFLSLKKVFIYNSIKYKFNDKLIQYELEFYYALILLTYADYLDKGNTYVNFGNERID